MKKIFFPIIFVTLCYCSNAQQLNQVTFSNGSDLLSFSLASSQNFLIRISDDGRILEYGTEEQSLYNNGYYATKLRPYVGSVEYFPTSADSAFRGKIKRIGNVFFTYFASTDYPEKVGKIKSAGSLFFEYYSKYDDPMFAGKVKKIGSDDIAFYSSVENEAYRGKLKMIGRTSLAYYSSFDDKAYKGKIKSIGAVQFAWYNSFDRAPGALKTGMRRQPVNGVTYIVQQ